LDEVVEEAKNMTAAGHSEIVLTGIFLGAYGQSTALRRRQNSAARQPLAELIEALCTQVPGLKRLRLSSIEPGDLSADLIHTLQSHEQIVPHFHLPLQSGSQQILRKMNRQYSRDDYFRMIDQVYDTFDRPALTTDIICGFPGESGEDFNQTLDIVRRAKFIHIHAFPFSPRPGTAAARWSDDFVPGKIANERIRQLTEMAEVFSYDFRCQFLGQAVTVSVERQSNMDNDLSTNRHGRCERYFDVEFQAPNAKPGDLLSVRIDEVAEDRTIGTLVKTSQFDAIEEKILA
jgi:threonylcarbamoyladenosine tRNA methylthiotransferase MtaB